MNLNDALSWFDSLEEEEQQETCCYITKQPIQHEIKLKCGHSFEYNALLIHFLTTQKNSAKHVCPYCRSSFPLFIPYHENACNNSNMKISLFKNNYLTCEYTYISGKKKNTRCNRMGHHYKNGIYCPCHNKQLVATEKKKQEQNFDLFFCTQMLKNGKPCMCKEFDITTHLCKRHFNLKNKELNKNT